MIDDLGTLWFQHLYSTLGLAKLAIFRRWIWRADRLNPAAATITTYNNISCDYCSACTTLHDAHWWEYNRFPPHVLFAKNGTCDWRSNERCDSNGCQSNAHPLPHVGAMETDVDDHGQIQGNDRSEQKTVAEDVWTSNNHNAHSSHIPKREEN